MINLSDVKIESSSMDTEVLNRLKNLYSTYEGTVPFDRNFGINPNILDEPIDIAKGKLVAEVIQKTQKYEPGIRVIEVKFNTKLDEGKVSPRVVVDIGS